MGYSQHRHASRFGHRGLNLGQTMNVVVLDSLKYYTLGMKQVGLCQCGCGNKAPLAVMTNRKRGWVKGEPVRFIHGHNGVGRIKTQEEIEKIKQARKGWRPTPEQVAKMRANMTYNYGEKHHNWKGGKYLTADGYYRVQRKGHPYAKEGGYVLEHRLVMEDHLGRFLERTEVVHHLNGIRTDNRLENLVVIGSHREHRLIHNGDFCKRGHPRNEENTVIRKDKRGEYRECIPCRKITSGKNS